MSVDPAIPNTFHFFISYAEVDREWAEWIAWQVEDAGYLVRIQAWDAAPGMHATLHLEEGLVGATRTLAVASRAYGRSVQQSVEAAFAHDRDPDGRYRKLIPVRIEEYDIGGLLGVRHPVDLFGRSEADAKRALINGISGAGRRWRAKPSWVPFPRGTATRRMAASSLRMPTVSPVFPGELRGSPSVRRSVRPDHARPRAPSDPQAVGGYRITHRLGTGAHGVVYLARSRGGRAVAVKVLHDAERRARERFEREIAAARGTASVHVPALLAADPAADPPYLVTEFVEGPSLEHEVRWRGAFTGADLQVLAIHLLTALDGLHRAGLVHGDLSPANVVLSAAGPRLVDLGPAGSAAGTPRLMAPEQWDGAATPASDLFAWACLVTYAGTRRWPYEGRTEAELRAAVQVREPDLTGLGEPLAGAVRAALAREPGRRPDAGELRERLGTRPDPRDVEAETEEPAGEPPAGVAPEPPPGPHRRAFLGVAAGTAAVSALALWAAEAGHLDLDDATAAERVADAADRLRGRDPGLARRLDVAAYQVAATRTTRANLLRHHGKVVARPAHTGAVRALAARRDGLLASAGDDGAVRTWRAGSLAPVGLIPGTAPVADLVFAPDGRLVSGDERGLVTVWDAGTGRAVRPPFAAHPGVFVSRTVLNGDGRLLATGGTDGLVKLWSMAELAGPGTPVPLRVLDHGSGAEKFSIVWGVAFAHADAMLVSIGDVPSSTLSLKLWDVADLRPGVHDRTPRADAQRVDRAFTGRGDVATHPRDGGVVAVTGAAIGGTPGTRLRFLRVTRSRNERGQSDAGVARAELPDFPGGIDRSLAVSPDGSRLAVGNERTTGGNLRLWLDAPPGWMPASDPSWFPVDLEGHPGQEVWAAAFTADGRRLVTGDRGGTVAVWDTEAADVVDRLCAAGLRPVSAQEWQRHLPGVDHRPVTC